IRDDLVTGVQTCALPIYPRQPNLALQLSQVAISFYLSGEFDAAVEAGRRAIRAYPDFAQTYRWHAAALGQVGWTAEATEALQKRSEERRVGKEGSVRRTS